MKEVKFFKYLSILLLIVNIGVIVFFVFVKPAGTLAENRQGAIEILHLDKKQGKQFHGLVMEHHEKMRDLNKKEQMLLGRYFAPVADSTINPVPKEQIWAVLKDIQRLKLEATYQHFEQVKQLLKPEQLPYLKEFIETVTSRNEDPQRKLPPPPKDF